MDRILPGAAGGSKPLQNPTELPARARGLGKLLYRPDPHWRLRKSAHDVQQPSTGSIDSSTTRAECGLDAFYLLPACRFGSKFHAVNKAVSLGAVQRCSPCRQQQRQCWTWPPAAPVGTELYAGGVVIPGSSSSLSILLIFPFTKPSPLSCKVPSSSRDLFNCAWDNT